MAPANGNGWIRWLVATLWGVLVMVIMFMGNVVRGNDLGNREAHATIVKESRASDKEIVDKIDKIDDTVTDIRLEQRTFIVEQREMKEMIRSLPR